MKQLSRARALAIDVSHLPDESRLGHEDEEAVEAARLRNGSTEKNKGGFFADLLIRSNLQEIERGLDADTVGRDRHTAEVRVLHETASQVAQMTRKSRIGVRHRRDQRGLQAHEQEKWKGETKGGNP